MRRTTVGIFVGFVVIAGAILYFGEAPQPDADSDQSVAQTAAERLAALKQRAEDEKDKSWWQKDKSIDADVLEDGEPGHMQDHAVVPVPDLVPAERSLDDVPPSAPGEEEIDPALIDKPRQEVRFPETRQVVSLGPQEADPRFGTDEDVSYESRDTEFAADAFAEIPDAGDVTAAAGSIAFWVQPSWKTDEPHEGSLVALAEGRLRLQKESDSLRFEFTNAAGDNGGIGAEIYEWQPGEWHYVLGTWNGNVMTLYVDGEQIAQGIRDGDLEMPEQPRLSVGSSAGGDLTPPPGIIKDIRVYKRAISSDEVNTHFRGLASQPVNKGAKD